MLFTDDDSKIEYRNSPQLLKSAVSILEDALARHGLQIMIINCEARGAAWIAAVGCADGDSDIIGYAVDTANQTLARSDKEPTIIYENEAIGLLSVRVTRAADLSTLQ